MFTMIGLLLGFGCLALLLWGVDRFARSRGYPGAHPFSPAIAYALLLGALLTVGLVVGGSYLDHRAASPLPATASKEAGE